MPSAVVADGEEQVAVLLIAQHADQTRFARRRADRGEWRFPPAAAGPDGSCSSSCSSSGTLMRTCSFLAQPHLLQGDIVLQMGQLRFHGDAVTLTGNAVTQGLAQQGRHIGDGVLLVEVGLGADRFQRVVHEMGVDLGAHQLHFRLGQRQVALVDLLDQGSECDWPSR